MKLVFGLGNPGTNYEGTRHNAGFGALGFLGKKLGIDIVKKRRGALVGDGRLMGEKILLIMPQTYMNKSGDCLYDFMAYYKAEPKDILVLYDDIDLPLSQVRIRAWGGAGTHNGMRDILEKLGDGNFARIRIGIDGPQQGDLVDYVLGKPAGEQAKPFAEGMEKAADAAYIYLTEGLEKAQQSYNVKGSKGEGE